MDFEILHNEPRDHLAGFKLARAPLPNPPSIVVGTGGIEPPTPTVSR